MARPVRARDLSGRLLAQMLPGTARIAKFASVLKTAAHAVVAILGNAGKVLPQDHFENDKDEPSEECFGAKPRDVYIKLSEDFCKPLFGKKIFGKVMEKQMKDLLAASTDHVVITDCGFAEEVST